MYGASKGSVLIGAVFLFVFAFCSGASPHGVAAGADEASRASAVQGKSDTGKSSSKVRFHARERRHVVRPLRSFGETIKCPKTHPNAVSGQVRAGYSIELGEMFPSLNAGGNRATGWSVGFSNRTTERHYLVAGVICSTVSVRYRFFESEVEPLSVDGGSIECPESAPYALSGMYFPDSETTGQIRLGDFYPWGRVPRGWAIGVKNLTNEHQTWLGGVVCSAQRVRFGEGYRDTLPPLSRPFFASDFYCPKRSPYAVSGWFAVVTPRVINRKERTGQLRLVNFDLFGPAWFTLVENLTNVVQEWSGGVMCMRGTGRYREHRTLRPTGSAEVFRTPPAVSHPPAHASIDQKYGLKKPTANVSRRLCRKPWYRDEHRKACRRYG
jgi:hypothetical protein